MVAATATLFTYVELRENRLERIGAVGTSPAFVDGASLALERATKDNLPVFAEDAVREERLLRATTFHVTTPTMARWMEVLFKRTDITTRAARTPLPKFAADAVMS